MKHVTEKSYDCVQDTLERLCRLNKLDISTSYSNISNSRYFNISCENGNEFKIRLAEHSAKPTYEIMNGIADYDIGSHDMATHNNINAFLHDFCKKFSLKKDNGISLRIKNHINNLEKIKARQAKFNEYKQDRLRIFKKNMEQKKQVAKKWLLKNNINLSEFEKKIWCELSKNGRIKFKKNNLFGLEVICSLKADKFFLKKGEGEMK